MGLEYFTQNPQTFLNGLGATTRPDQQDLNRIGLLLDSRPIVRANYFIALPAPAALAAIGTVNSLSFAMNIVQERPADEAAIPYYLSIAVAWNDIGRQLAVDSPAETPAPTATETDERAAWPPPWLDFLENVES